ncbi:MAG: hypothetical protein KDA59_26465 [Planctomycetales bacterium]|nr:hypothetical protein [Planctomycetales bacterium]
MLTSMIASVFAILFQILGVIGSIASVVSLILAERIRTRLKREERRILRQVQLPKYINDLRGHHGNLERAIAAKRREPIERYVEACRVAIASLRPLVSPEISKEIGNLLATPIFAGPYSADEKLHFGMNRLIFEIESLMTKVQNFHEEENLRISNGQ